MFLLFPCGLQNLNQGDKWVLRRWQQQALLLLLSKFQTLHDSTLICFLRPSLQYKFSLCCNFWNNVVCADHCRLPSFLKRFSRCRNRESIVRIQFSLPWKCNLYAQISNLIFAPAAPSSTVGERVWGWPPTPLHTLHGKWKPVGSDDDKIC